QKIGEDNVKSLLKEINLDEKKSQRLIDFISDKSDNKSLLESLKNRYDKELFNEGLDELTKVYSYMLEFVIPDENIVIDLSITRGLDYYTSTVYETFIKGYENIGSVCSGGRYDNLANNFSKQNLPGVGMSIGLTRLFYQFSQLDLL